MGTYVKDGNSCIGCEAVKSFPDGCCDCPNLKSNYAILTIICKNRLPKYCTPAQYIEIRGKDYPDDGPVWARHIRDDIWSLTDFGETKDDNNDYEYVIANTDGKPPTDYRPITGITGS